MQTSIKAQRLKATEAIVDASFSLWGTGRSVGLGGGGRGVAGERWVASTDTIRERMEEKEEERRGRSASAGVSILVTVVCRSLASKDVSSVTASSSVEELCSILLVGASLRVKPL